MSCSWKGTIPYRVSLSAIATTTMMWLLYGVTSYGLVEKLLKGVMRMGPAILKATEISLCRLDATFFVVGNERKTIGQFSKEGVGSAGTKATRSCVGRERAGNGKPSARNAGQVCKCNFSPPTCGGNGVCGL